MTENYEMERKFEKQEEELREDVTRPSI